VVYVFSISFFGEFSAIHRSLRPIGSLFGLGVVVVILFPVVSLCGHLLHPRIQPETFGGRWRTFIGFAFLNEGILPPPLPVFSKGIQLMIGNVRGFGGGRFTGIVRVPAERERERPEAARECGQVLPAA
jgi:hypothetical protein